VSGDENAAGARIARARRRRGLSQSVLAGLVGRSESWLSQVERGKRGVDSYAVLTRMAEVLRVEVEELTGPGGGDGEEGQRVYEPAAEIERAMMGYEAVSASIGGREPGARAPRRTCGPGLRPRTPGTRPPATTTPAGYCPR
jgi:transcriptional regulator with XRE-family HTH domain